ncbi:hypothetical protein BDR22DRAFT_528684 [Usnea florida]
MRTFLQSSGRKLHTNCITGHNTRTTFSQVNLGNQNIRRNTKDLTMNEAEISTVEKALTHLNINPSTDALPQGMTDTPQSKIAAKVHYLSEFGKTKLLLTVALRLNTECPQYDFERSLSMCNSLGLDEQNRLKWMIQSRELRDWLHLPKSQKLFINGNGPMNGLNEMYPPSAVLSAKLLERLGRIEPVISLGFFCSFHTNFGWDPEHCCENPFGLLKSFVLQLLKRDIPWDLRFLRYEDFFKIKNNHIDFIWVLFRRLVDQLPKNTFLFLIIDGINKHGGFEMRHEFTKVIGELLEMVKRPNGVIIKLLLISHGCHFFSWHRNGLFNWKVDDKVTLNVPETGDGGRQGLSELDFQSTIDPELERLKAEIAVGESSRMVMQEPSHFTKKLLTLLLGK